jgi:hypothetical protein
VPFGDRNDDIAQAVVHQSVHLIRLSQHDVCDPVARAMLPAENPVFIRLRSRLTSEAPQTEIGLAFTINGDRAVTVGDGT